MKLSGIMCLLIILKSQSHEKAGLYPLSRKYSFGKTTEGDHRGGITPQPFLG